MQKMQARRRLEAMQVVGPAEHISDGTVLIVPRQDADCREIQPEVNLRGVDLTFLRHDVNANAAAMEFTRAVVRLARFVCGVMMARAAIDRLR